jgi:hypothetical protein
MRCRRDTGGDFRGDVVEEGKNEIDDGEGEEG